MQGDWQKVSRKNGKRFVDKWDIHKNNRGIANNNTTTFFFSDFKDSWRAKYLFFEFKDIGEIEEIVIPIKKDWRGKKYGFVRFIDVGDVKWEETKLNNIWLEGCKISANLSKYQRKEVRHVPGKVNFKAGMFKEESKPKA